MKEEGIKSDEDIYAGEIATSQAAESDEKLGTVPHANERVGRHHLRVKEETAKPEDSSDVEEAKLAMNVEKVELQTQDWYIFILTHILVTGQQAPLHCNLTYRRQYITHQPMLCI